MGAIATRYQGVSFMREGLREDIDASMAWCLHVSEITTSDCGEPTSTDEASAHASETDAHPSHAPFQVGTGRSAKRKGKANSRHPREIGTGRVRFRARKIAFIRPQVACQACHVGVARGSSAQSSSAFAEALPSSRSRAYRRAVAVATTTRPRQGVWRLLTLFVLPVGCTTIDPGSNFVVPDETFDADFFYCHVEPELIFAKNCGPGDPTLDPPKSCHFSSAAVTGMALIDHPAVPCGGGDHPLDATQTGPGSFAESNFESVSLEMSRQYTMAPLFTRPTGNNHPRQIFAPDDSQVNALLAAWASK